MIPAARGGAVYGAGLARPARKGLVVFALVAALAGCGHEEKHGPDPRKPPPIPPKADGTSPANPRPAAGVPQDPPPAPKKDKDKDKDKEKEKPAAPAAPAVEVETATPLRKTVPVTLEYTGQTVGSETIEIRARVEGYLQSIHFTEGTFVEKGALLYQIEPDKMQEVVEQAEGTLGIAKADEEKAIRDVERNRPLVEKNAISREEYETSLSAQKAAHARVDAAEAALRRAKINLGYATVRAPAAGLVGKTEVDVGNLVGRGESTLLTTISQVDPIYAEVRISETDMLHYQTEIDSGKRKRDGLPLTLNFSDGTTHPHPGKIAVVDRNIDTKTGTLLVQISFPNPDRKVRPGMFARVQAVREVLDDALLLPQGAIEELQGTFRLYVVEAGDVVRGKAVVPGPRIGPLWVISQGLGADDRVVVQGRQKVRDGSTVKQTRVKIGEDGALVPEAAPAPAGGDGATDPVRKP